jgi:ABC-2 type transport system permease protein
MAIGLFTSAFATSEFQAVQFMPAVVMPQALLCGLIAPRERMASWLRAASDLMPLSYAVDALTKVGAHGNLTTPIARDIAVVLGCTILVIALAASTLRRQSE